MGIYLAQMLVVEIAVGVLIGLLLYRSFEAFCKWYNCTIPAGIFLIIWQTLVFAVPIAAIILVGPYLYTKAKEKFTPHDKIIFTDDPKVLPPDPPGYFYIRELGKTTEDWNNPKKPLLRGGHCVADCDTNRPLWLVPKSPH
jgi:hypothetical protein